MSTEIPRRPGADRPPVQQRSGPAHLAGDPAGHRRRARPARAGLQPQRLAYERRSFGLPGAGAHPRAGGGRRTFERGRRNGAQRVRVFTTHTPVPAGNDEFPLVADR